MKHMKFVEYLDRNKKLKTSGTVKTVADFEGTVDSKPAKEKKHKDAGGEGQKGEAKPYKGGVDAKDPNKGKNNDGFANKGGKELEYKPKTDVPAKVGEGGTKKASWPKTKMQEWLEKTKGLSLAEFTKSVRNENVKGLDECACQPHNSIKDTVEACKCNKRQLSALVREMKRNDLFNSLFAEMVSHSESYAVLAKLMGKDESVAKKLVKALNEDVAPPMGDSLVPMKKKKPVLGDDMGDTDMDSDSEEMGDEENMDMDSEEGDMDSDSEEMGDSEESEMGDDIGGDDTMMPPPKKKKGMSNLLGAMKSHAPDMNIGM